MEAGRGVSPEYIESEVGNERIGQCENNMEKV
jgi:hypothetical protein